jgi:hypothetical protein
MRALLTNPLALFIVMSSPITRLILDFSLTYFLPLETWIGGNDSFLFALISFPFGLIGLQVFSSEVSLPRVFYKGYKYLPSRSPRRRMLELWMPSLVL